MGRVLVMAFSVAFVFIFIPKLRIDGYIDLLDKHSFPLLIALFPIHPFPPTPLFC